MQSIIFTKILFTTYLHYLKLFLSIFYITNLKMSNLFCFTDKNIY